MDDAGRAGHVPRTGRARGLGDAGQEGLIAQDGVELVVETRRARATRRTASSGRRSTTQRWWRPLPFRSPFWVWSFLSRPAQRATIGLESKPSAVWRSASLIEHLDACEQLHFRAWRSQQRVRRALRDRTLAVPTGAPRARHTSTRLRRQPTTPICRQGETVLLRRLRAAQVGVRFQVWRSRLATWIKPIERSLRPGVDDWRWCSSGGMSPRLVCREWCE